MPSKEVPLSGGGGGQQTTTHGNFRVINMNRCPWVAAQPPHFPFEERVW